MSNEDNRLSLHFKYCAFIAVAIIIAISTERWSSNKDFTTYLSNAATMTSLLLGVVAIFYSFISNDGMSRSLGSISTVTSEVREARDKIEGFVQLTTSATKTSAESNSNIQMASEKLSDSLGVFENTLKALVTQNEKLQSFVSELPTRFDQLETKVGDVAKILGEKPAIPMPTVNFSNFPDEFIEAFLERSTLNQNLFTYACVMAKEKNKDFKISDFCQAINSNIQSSLFGFLSCMSAIQVCIKSPSAKSTDPVKIFKMHPYLLENSKSYFLKYIDDRDFMGTDESSEWLRKLEAVELLFNNARS